MTGQVYWITGLSGAGKTTIGSRLYYRLKDQRPQTTLLDGDVMKLIFDGAEVDYSPEGRRVRAEKYSQLCKYLSDQGFTVICCAIAMYDQVRAWNRQNIANYLEVFIDVDLDTLIRTDPKGHYQRQGRAMAGAGFEAELPKNPDLVIKNDLRTESINTYVELILAAGADPGLEPDGRAYWNQYYAAKSGPAGPSDFARFVAEYLEPGQKLIDLGCGEGRDSLYFQGLGLRVSAVDSAREAIGLIEAQKRPVFAVCDDFVRAKALFCVDYAHAYARWVVHAINVEQQAEMIRNVHQALTDGGRFFIEVRTVADPKYGLGDPLEPDAFFQDQHYRRFIRPGELRRELEEQGFVIDYFQESDQFSVVGEDRPCLLRVVARKSTA